MKKHSPAWEVLSHRVTEAIDRVAAQPEIFASLALGVRFYRVKRFPY